MVNNKVSIIIIFIGLSIFLIGCSISFEEETIINQEIVKFENVDWRNSILTNVQDNSEFRINDFSSKPIILESFATWCPISVKQQNEFVDVLEILGDEVTIISLNTDSNEGYWLVKNSAESHGFDWQYATSSVEVTKSLMNEFGSEILNVPGAPVVLICPNGNTELLGLGIKSAEDIISSIEEICA